jgi:hypothetical protein
MFENRSVAISREHGLTVSENMALRRIFKPKEEVTEG